MIMGKTKTCATDIFFYQLRKSKLIYFLFSGLLFESCVYIEKYDASRDLSKREQAYNQSSHCLVTDFGAKGDGKNDDSEAIQRAINSLPKSLSNQSTELEGGRVYFAPGIYRITRQIKIDKANRSVELVGTGGRGSTILVFEGKKSHILATGEDTGAGYTKGLTFKGLKFQSHSKSNNSILHIRHSHYFSIEDCWFQGDSLGAILIEDALDGKLENIRIDTASKSNRGFQFGIQLRRNSHIGAPNQIQVSNCWIEDTKRAAILVHKAEKVHIHNCLIQSNEEIGIKLQESNSVSISNNYFEANGQSQEDNLSDISLSGENLSRNIRIKGNHFSLHGNGKGFHVLDAEDVRGISFSENDLRGGNPQSILFREDCIGIVVEDNISTFIPKLDIPDSHTNLRFQNNLTVNGKTWNVSKE